MSKGIRTDPGCVDQRRIQAAVREILEAIGENPDREGLKETPARVARMYEELFSGLCDDPAQHLTTVFTERYDAIVILRDIPFHSMCEHHLLPFFGRAHVAYMPNGEVLGLSKLARVVDGYAGRPQLQERMTSQIADLIEKKVNARGVAVVIEATHTCMTIRGVKKPGSNMITSSMRGVFREDVRSRNEVLALIHAPRMGG